MKITKDEFKAYEEVRKSGETNMCYRNAVSQLSGLNLGKVNKIMMNYSTYKTKFNF